MRQMEPRKRTSDVERSHGKQPPVGGKKKERFETARPWSVQSRRVALSVEREQEMYDPERWDGMS